MSLQFEQRPVRLLFSGLTDSFGLGPPRGDPLIGPTRGELPGFATLLFDPPHPGFADAKAQGHRLRQKRPRHRDETQVSKLAWSPPSGHSDYPIPLEGASLWGKALLQAIREFILAATTAHVVFVVVASTDCLRIVCRRSNWLDGGFRRNALSANRICPGSPLIAGERD